MPKLLPVDLKVRIFRALSNWSVPVSLMSVSTVSIVFGLLTGKHDWLMSGAAFSILALASMGFAFTVTADSLLFRVNRALDELQAANSKDNPTPRPVPPAVAPRFKN